MTWFLVFIGASSGLGPLPLDACMAAAAHLASQGIVCKEAKMFIACGVDGKPGTYTACPIFEWPEVTTK